MGYPLKRFLKKIFFVFLLTTTLFAAELNTSFIHNDNNFYQKLLENLKSKESNSSDEINLEKTLLKKIIELSSKEPNFSIPTLTPAYSQEEYRKLFEKFLEKSMQKEHLQAAIAHNQERLQTLHNQIKEKNTTLLTSKLFYTLYYKQNQLFQKQLRFNQNLLKKIQKTLLSSLAHIKFNQTNIEKTIQSQKRQIEYLNKYKERLALQKERFTLLNKMQKAKEFDKKIENANKEIDELYKQIVQNLFLKFSFALKEKNQKAFKLHKIIINTAKERLKEDSSIIDDIDWLLSNMEKSTFGRVATIKGKGIEEFKSELQKLWEFANKSLFTINKTPVSLVKLALALLIFVLGFLLGNFYKKQIKKIALKNKTITSTTQTILSNLGYYFIFIITFFIALKVLGINLSSLALVAGALSVGIGFGLQNIVSNFVSGIILMVERSIKIGDYIEIDENLRGRVTDIKMRSITINTNSNIDVIVPNQDLIQNRVINWTMNDKIRRFEIPFGVAYGTNPQKVIDIILEAVQKSAFSDIYNTPSKHTRVIMTGMSDSSVDFELFVWIKGEETLYPKRTISRFLILIYNALYEHNIEIPFPQRDLHIRSISEPIPITIKNKDS